MIDGPGPENADGIYVELAERAVKPFGQIVVHRVCVGDGSSASVLNGTPNSAERFLTGFIGGVK